MKATTKKVYTLGAFFGAQTCCNKLYVGFDFPMRDLISYVADYAAMTSVLD